MDNKQFGVLLASDIECQVDPIKCIICQEDKKEKPPISLSAGRESLKRTASVKDDVVFKRMKILYITIQMHVIEITLIISPLRQQQNAMLVSFLVCQNLKRQLEKLKCSNNQCHYAVLVLHVLHQAQRKILESSYVQYVVQKH